MSVLHLVVGDEAEFVGGLDAEEDGGEAGVLEELQESEVVGEIERGFGDKAEWVAAFPAPLGHCGEEFLGTLFIADEVVVDDEDGVAPAGLLELIEFGEHLGDGLGARLAAVDLDDVAELAVEGTAARVLHGHGAVAIHFDEAEVGQRADAHGGTLCGFVYGLGATDGEIVGQGSDECFCFADDDVVGFKIGRRHAAGDGTADYGAVATRAAALDDGDEVFVLGMHAADHGERQPRRGLYR